MNQFYKVTNQQYEDATDRIGVNLEDEYNNIKLPQRGTAFSSGYDFFAPYDIDLSPWDEVLIPTGVGVELDEDKFLMCVPRSGLGFKFGLGLANTVGIIDADYSHATNGGHIMAKLTSQDKPIHINKGQAFMQGIIIPYFRVDGDMTDTLRVGGFGSTDA